MACGWEGGLTAPANVDKEVALEDGASLQHLCRSDRVDGFCLLVFLTYLGAWAFTRHAEHAIGRARAQIRHGALQLLPHPHPGAGERAAGRAIAWHTANLNSSSVLETDSIFGTDPW